MKVLLFSHEFPPMLGGAGTVGYELTKLLVADGHNVDVLTCRQESRNANDFSHINNFYQVRSLKKIWFLSYIRQFNLRKYDLIILNDIGATFVAGLTFSKKSLTKSVIFLHGSEPEKVFVSVGLTKKLIGFKKAYERALKYSQQIVCVSNFMKEKFLKYTELDIFEPKISVLPNFVDNKVFFPQDDPSFRSSRSLPDDTVIFGSVSRLVGGKGYFEKIEIFEKLVLEGSRDFYWVIVGDGPDKNIFEQLIKDKGLSDHIVFLGQMAQSQLPLIYSNIDYFWLLSNFEEAFGLVYLEAQACGCTVIAKNQYGVKECIANGVSGYLVDDTNDVIHFVYNDLRDPIKKEAVLEFAKNYNPDGHKEFFQRIARRRYS